MNQSKALHLWNERPEHLSSFKSGIKLYYLLQLNFFLSSFSCFSSCLFLLSFKCSFTVFLFYLNLFLIISCHCKTLWTAMFLNGASEINMFKHLFIEIQILQSASALFVLSEPPYTPALLCFKFTYNEPTPSETHK